MKITKITDITNLINIGVGGGITVDPAIAILNDGNTVAWYDSQDLTTITKDGSNFVSLWKDKLLSGHDLVQATGTNQPLYSADGIGFDGVDNYLKTATFTLAQPEKIYIVLRQRTWASTTIFDGFNAYSSFMSQFGVEPQIRVFGGASYSVQLSNLIINSFGIIRILFNGAGSKFQVNENAADTGSWGTVAMNGFTLGARGSGSSFTNIQVKEVIIRKVADDSTNETAIYNYLKNKYSL